MCYCAVADATRQPYCVVACVLASPHTLLLVTLAFGIYIHGRRVDSGLMRDSTGRGVVAEG
jgi:hypothetical protein